MAAVPEAEKRPQGLELLWCHAWDQALKVMKARGTWDRSLRPFLDEYVYALRAAQLAREAGRPVDWDRHAKRALALADLLVLTPAARRSSGADARPEDPFAGLDGADDGPRLARQPPDRPMYDRSPKPEGDA